MILGYRDRRTAAFARGDFVKEWDAFRDQAVRRLQVLNAAVSLQDLANLPSNRLEALKGDRKGQHSIRINKQWRVCFEWDGVEGGPRNVEIVDYHG